MTYEQYIKEGNSITKEEYVQVQQTDIKENIKTQKRNRNLCIYGTLAVPSAVVLFEYLLKGNISQITNKPFLYYAPIAIGELVYAFAIRHYSKTVNELKNIKVPLPTNEELSNYNELQYHLSESERLGNKLEKKR